MSEDWNEVPEDYHGHREMDDTHVIISKKDFATKYVSRVLYDEAQARIAELEAENAALKAAQLKDPFEMTEAELREFLSKNGYDYDDLRRKGLLFVNRLKSELPQPPDPQC